MEDYKKKQGNHTKIGMSDAPLFCHSYEEKTPPKKFEFESLPGGQADLRNAREDYVDEETGD